MGWKKKSANNWSLPCLRISRCGGHSFSGIRFSGDADKALFPDWAQAGRQAARRWVQFVGCPAERQRQRPLPSFVKRFFKNVPSDRYLAVQPIAVKWTPDQLGFSSAAIQPCRWKTELALRPGNLDPACPARRRIGKSPRACRPGAQSGEARDTPAAGRSVRL